jgi:hypothetical protein
LDKPGVHAISARQMAVSRLSIGLTGILVAHGEIRCHYFIGTIGAVVALMMRLSCGGIVMPVRSRQMESLQRSVVSGRSAIGPRVTGGIDVFPFVYNTAL